jgi:hemolysin III
MGTIKHYSPGEEKTNIISHAIGLLLSVVALVLMVVRAGLHGNLLQLVSVSIFGVSLIALYAASTFYHSAKDPGQRARLRIIDHATIYVLIAGTYTPLTLISLGGWVGWAIFGASWAMAAIGISLKVFFTGKFDLISTLMYVFMGWIIVFAIKPLMDNMSSEGLFWLFAGGVAYTTGAIIYSIKKIPFNHAIFHLFVLLGSFCHFISVYFYVLPTG